MKSPTFFTQTFLDYNIIHVSPLSMDLETFEEEVNRGSFAEDQDHSSLKKRLNSQSKRGLLSRRICAGGTAIPPLIIFKAKKLSTEWVPADICNEW